MTQAFRRRLKHAAVVGTGFAILCAVAPYIPPLKRLERISLDWRYRNANRNTQAPSEVVVVDIDESSLKVMAPHFGRWPWPRHVYKELLSFLGQGEPRAVVFDVLFTEKMLGTDDDHQLFEMGLGMGNVSHGINLLDERADGAKGLGTFPKDFPNKYALTFKGSETFPHHSFLDAVVHEDEFIPLLNRLHVATFGEDDDGVFRRAPLLFPVGETWLPALTLGSLMLSSQATVTYDGQVAIQDGDKHYEIPVDDLGLMPIHYYRLGNDPKSVSIASIFDSYRHLQMGEDLPAGAVSPFEFKDKVVIVGASAVGLSDLKRSPIRSLYPGALVQATAVSNILTHDFLKTIPNWALAAVATILVFICYLSILTIESFITKTGVVLLACGVYATLSIWLFKYRSVDIGLLLPLFLSAASTFEGLLYLALVEGREKRRMQSTLSKYLSPEVTKTLIETGQDPHAEDGRQQEITILFTDIRSFTTISEAHPAPEVVHHLNNYLGRMTEIIFNEAGTLDKFVGDAIMAFWGAPLKNDQHAEFAVRCALKMAATVEQLRQEVGVDSPFAFKTGIGINTGSVVVGNIGSNRRLDYTVIGDNVNLAARIESVTKDFRSPILIGESTYNAVKDVIVCRVIDENVQIKGKMQYIRLFQPLCEKSSPQRETMEAFAQEFENAQKVYRTGNFEAALKLFLKLDMARNGMDGPSQLYRDRCRHWTLHPPENWSGYDTQKASGH
ncbi:MAG: adenylate/guanylate cyclase domain-containing protein [Deltaproteobacteria bacterium]|nr:adenylate/guanylate cyclase domain-containing protein [Deltaproteobacteria bacterium]MBI3296343.1 adenylate/guanylate cyclase domain-containing protein [Deltaproteobacteria bacterium]